MPLDEIDEIFAKHPHTGPSKQPSSKKRKSPRTVSESFKKRVKVEKVKKREEGKKDDGLKRFKDSRGSGPRRTTDEGYPIYNEDELGIGGEGGDTPLCPFDCQCCF